MLKSYTQHYLELLEDPDADPQHWLEAYCNSCCLQFDFPILSIVDDRCCTNCRFEIKGLAHLRNLRINKKNMDLKNKIFKFAIAE